MDDLRIPRWLKWAEYDSWKALWRQGFADLQINEDIMLISAFSSFTEIGNLWVFNVDLIKRLTTKRIQMECEEHLSAILRTEYPNTLIHVGTRIGKQDALVRFDNLPKGLTWKDGKADITWATWWILDDGMAKVELK